MFGAAVRFALLMIALLVGVVTPGSAVTPVVLFDQGHGQRFLVEESGELHLSQLAQVFRDSGYEVRSTRTPIDAAILREVTVLVTSGLFRPYTPGELQAILGFIEGGGGLAAMLHVAPTYGNLLQALGVLASKGVLYEGEGVLGGNPQDYRVASFADHTLVAGLDHFSLYGGWAVMAGGRDPAVKTVAFTSPSSWIDADRDRQQGPQEVAHSFGVLVAGERGRGRFVVFGDDAIFQNRFLDPANRKLAGNLPAWLRPDR